jgi:hypothetical protein
MLSPFQEKLVLSVCPKGSRVKKANYFQEEYLPCPIRVAVRVPGGSERVLVLRMVRHSDGSIEKEARLFPVLLKLGLPVPEILAGPEKDPDSSGDPLVAVYSFLPGVSLQELSEGSKDGCELAIRLLLQATARLAELTPRIQSELGTNSIPEITLSIQLKIILDKGGPWLQEGEFSKAVEKLDPILEKIDGPPVFTNGDYQAANFLTDGEKVTGFVDFEYASYQDFSFGFAKYPIYDLAPLNKAGLVSRLMREKGISSDEFAIRVAVGCLKTLQREIPVTGGDDEYRTHVLGLLKEALNAV